METATTVTMALAGLFFSLMCGLLMEELICARIVPVVFRAANRTSTREVKARRACLGDDYVVHQIHVAGGRRWDVRNGGRHRRQRSLDGGSVSAKNRHRSHRGRTATNPLADHRSAGLSRLGSATYRAQHRGRNCRGGHADPEAANRDRSAVHECSLMPQDSEGPAGFSPRTRGALGNQPSDSSGQPNTAAVGLPGCKTRLMTELVRVLGKAASLANYNQGHSMKLFSRLRSCGRLLLMFSFALPAMAADWSAPVAEMAKAIASASGSGTVTLSVVNSSSLSKDQVTDIQRALEARLRSSGLRLEPAASSDVRLTLSENLRTYVWVAEIRKAADTQVEMVTLPRGSPAAT